MYFQSYKGIRPDILYHLKKGGTSLIVNGFSKSNGRLMALLTDIRLD
jgi:hypothetical protein